jgi:RNA polymerase-binding transcription factor DksA
MSGYIGNPDAEAEQAQIINENGIHAARLALQGPVYLDCQDCGEEINRLRVAFMLEHKITCTRCTDCQQVVDLQPKPQIKMLDRIL